MESAFDNGFTFQEFNAALLPNFGNDEGTFAFENEGGSQSNDFHIDNSAADGSHSRDAVADAIRHRRSRNGCLTCRNRRVKCDETRPICERCRKGGRDCVFPEAASKSKGSKPTRKPTHSNSISELTSGAADADSPDSHSATDRTSKSPRATSSIFEYGDSKESSHSPGPLKPYSPQSASSPNSTGFPGGSGGSKLAALDSDLRFYLKYHNDHMTNFHYGLTYDSKEFLQEFMIEHALSHEPLLYAVVSLAAYHYTLTNPTGKLQDFLGHYSTAMSLLRLSIRDGKEASLDTLLTILVLSLLEEYLGDWVNLLNHQKAAFRILTNLYTPQTITANYTLTKLLEFYIHFDCIVGFVGAAETQLTRDWYEAQRAFYENMAEIEVSSGRPMTLQNTSLLTFLYEEKHAASRLLAKDVSIFFARLGKFPSDTSFEQEVEAFHERIEDWHRSVNPLLVDKSKVVMDVPTTLPWNSADAYELGSDVVLYGGELETTNYMIAGFWGLELMFKSTLALMQRTQPSLDVQMLAGKIFRVHELAWWIRPSKSAVLALQPSVSIACVFLRKESSLVKWCRRELALTEQLGYFHPMSFRKRLSEAWDVDLMHWWLPNEEGFLPILRSIRDFIEYRTTPPKDRASEDMREMTGIFKSMDLNADIPGYMY